MRFIITPDKDSSTKDAPSFKVLVLESPQANLKTAETNFVASKDLSGWLQTQLLQGKITEIRLDVVEGTPEPRYTSADKARTASG
jgi:hypothetical protein